MGLFLHILLFPGGEQSACEAALRQAADLAARELTTYAMAPSDLLRWLPAAFHSLDQ